VREKALLFGAHKSLAGILTEPAEKGDPKRPAVIILNAGVLHHVGPNRLHVRLARELARSGLASLRFDFSGLGDSRPRTDALPFAEVVVEEVGQAMTALQSLRGAQSFLLAGICSGADNAVAVATRDPRVSGAALVEPYSVPVPGFLLYSYRRRLLNPMSWWRLLRGRSEILDGLRARLRRAPAPSPNLGPGRLGAEEPPVSTSNGQSRGDDPKAAVALPRGAELVPPLAAFAADVGRLLDKGLRLSLTYSVESPAYFNYLTTLRPRVRPFLRDGRARLFVFDRTDHIFSPLAVQERFVEAIRSWAAGVTPGS
jgi:hypothetical protein